MNKMWDLKFFYSLCYNFHVAFFLQECNQEFVKIVFFFARCLLVMSMSLPLGKEGALVSWL